MEIWKEVRGNHNYAISTQGRVRRLTTGPGAVRGRILKPTVDSKGYLQVGLHSGGKKTKRLVHQLVAIAFLWPRPGLEVNHKNGIPKDNRLCNLELVTRSENMRHAVRTGLMPVGEQRHNAKLCEESVREIRELGALGLTQQALGKRFGVSPSRIWYVLNRVRWAHVA